MAPWKSGVYSGVKTLMAFPRSNNHHLLSNTRIQLLEVVCFVVVIVVIILCFCFSCCCVVVVRCSFFLECPD